MFRLPLIAAAAYLLGSVPFGYLLVRIFRGEDVRLAGSGNIGATNVARKSPALGAFTLLLDALKGSTAVAVGIFLSPPFFGRFSTSAIPWRQLLPPDSREFAFWAALAALFAVAGHIFPIWLNFRGGKGVATAPAFLMMPQSVLLFALASRHPRPDPRSFLLGSTPQSGLPPSPVMRIRKIPLAM
jgi:acyl-phosphate glycerol 3-phosphate acyltransferase